MGVFGQVICGGMVMTDKDYQQLVEEMGLDTPFTAKLTYALAKQGVVVSSDLSRLDFIKKLISSNRQSSCSNLCLSFLFVLATK